MREGATSNRDRQRFGGSARDRSMGNRPSPKGAVWELLTIALVATIAFSQSPASGSRESQRQKKRNDGITRLEPSAFPKLPPEIQAELSRRGCLVPQSYALQAPHNVVRGHFISPDQLDVAVLCSKHGVSTLLLFHGGSIDSVEELGSARDSNFMQVIGPDLEVGYSWVIEVATPKYIEEHYELFGGPLPPPYDHDGINDIFAEKGSVVLYWDGNAWLNLAGSD